MSYSCNSNCHFITLSWISVVWISYLFLSILWQYKDKTTFLAWDLFHTFVVANFDALAQTSDFQIERRQIVLLCWMQDSKLGSLRHQFANRLNIHIIQLLLQLSSGVFSLLQFHHTNSTLMMTRNPIYQHGLTLISAWMSNYNHYKVWDEITYPFPNFNNATIEIREWTSNAIPHLTGHVITYPWLDWS